MIAAALWLALVLAGQAQPPSPLSPLVVEGKRAAPPSAQEARDYVWDVSKAGGAHDQLARFDEPICVRSAGVDAPFDGVLSQVILRAAKEAGAKIDADPNCTGNLIILYAADIEAVMKQLHDHRWDWLDGPQVSNRAMTAFTRERRPVTWWRIVTSGDESGAPALNANEPDAAPIYNRFSSSRITSDVVDHLSKMIVVVDGARVKGVSVGQLGDYIAMAALGDVDPEAAPSKNSILSLFEAEPDPAAPRLRLTAWDKAYLKAFYRSFSNRKATSQQSQIAADIADQFKTGGPAAAKPPGR